MGAHSLLDDDLPVLEAFVLATSSQAMIDVVFAHPRLLSEDHVATLKQEAALLQDDVRSVVDSALTKFEQIQSSLLQDPSQYPIGAGPIERVWKRQLDGDIDNIEAERLVTRPEVTKELSPMYVQILCRHAVSSATSYQWRDMLKLRRLLLASSAYAARSRDGDYIRERIAIDSVDIARSALVMVPDGRVLADAHAVGTHWLRKPSMAGNRVFCGAMMHRLGALHLDPYTADRLSTGFGEQHEAWLKRFTEEYGSELSGSLSDIPPMPEPVDALRTADEYFGEAVRLNEGHAKGLSLKARAQALEWLEILGEPIPEQELIDICREALRYLDPRRGARQRSAVESTLARHGARP